MEGGGRCRCGRLAFWHSNKNYLVRIDRPASHQKRIIHFDRTCENWQELVNFPSSDDRIRDWYKEALQTMAANTQTLSVINEERKLKSTSLCMFPAVCIRSSIGVDPESKLLRLTIVG
jgi:hypothetical protein